jgi:hypothetical protein
MRTFLNTQSLIGNQGTLEIIPIVAYHLPLSGRSLNVPTAIIKALLIQVKSL